MSHIHIIHQFGFSIKSSLFMEHMIVDLVEKTIERDQEARQVKEVKEKLFGRMGAAMGISPFGII